LLDCRFAQEDKGPSDFQVIRRVPFRLDSFEGVPGALNHGALQEAVLRRFVFVGVADLA
jgi:hypothetical protein